MSPIPPKAGVQIPLQEAKQPRMKASLPEPTKHILALPNEF